MDYMAVKSCVDSSTGYKLLKGQVVTYDARLCYYPVVPDSCFQIIMHTSNHSTIPLTELLITGMDAPFPSEYTF